MWDKLLKLRRGNQSLKQSGTYCGKAAGVVWKKFTWGGI